MPTINITGGTLTYTTASSDDPITTTASNRDTAGNVRLPYRPRSDNAIVMDMQPEDAIQRRFDIAVYLKKPFDAGLRMKIANVKNATFTQSLKPRRVIDAVIQDEYLSEIKEVGQYLYCVTDWLEGQGYTWHGQMTDFTYLFLHVVGDVTKVKADGFYLQPADGSDYYVNGEKYIYED
jgi:hypothetical protein